VFHKQFNCFRPTATSDSALDPARGARGGKLPRAAAPGLCGTWLCSQGTTGRFRFSLCNPLSEPQAIDELI